MSYVQGFNAGECQSYSDRAAGVYRLVPKRVTSQRERGYWDGYCARDAAWAAMSVTGKAFAEAEQKDPPPLQPAKEAA